MVVFTTQRSKLKMSSIQCPMDMPKNEKSQRKRLLFGLISDAKIVLGKMHYRCDVCTIGSQDSKSKVRKMNDQKLTRLRRISKVTHSRKQWTEIEVGNSLVLS